MTNSEARKRKASSNSDGEGGVANSSGVSGITGPAAGVVLSGGQDCDDQATGNEEVRVVPGGPAGQYIEGRSEEVRVTASSGGQKGSKPARYDLIPTDALEQLARHYGKGNAKYPAVNGLDNWRNGYPWSLSYAAMQRHLHAFWSGEDYDEETGSLHLVAAAWHCFTLIHFLGNDSLPGEYDDRQDVLDRYTR